MVYSFNLGSQDKMPMSQNHTRKPTRKNAPPNPKAPIPKHLAVVDIVILYYIKFPWSLQIDKL